MPQLLPSAFKMFRFIVVVVAIASCTAIPKALNPRLRGIDGRIVGGNETTIQQHPWQVSLRYRGNHYCGGSIISRDTIVTAAHCADGLIIGTDKVVVGSTRLSGGGIEYEVATFVIHENYDSWYLINDIAIIKLEGKLDYSDSVQNVKLPDQELPDGSEVTASGWGTENEGDSFLPDVLRQVNVNIIGRKECQAKYPSEEILPNMICAGVNGGGKDACQGDSGGPLTADGTLYGVVSWGYGCARPQYPGVYSNVANLRKWIKDNSGI